VEAPTERTAAILLDQYQGVFRRALQTVESHLTCNDVSAASAAFEELARFGALGRHLTKPWRVVIAGAPNVGKSSLLNALAGFQRSIVAPTPGTTRDLVTVQLAIDGWPVEFIDTAGMRDAEEMLEGQGIEQARAIAATADLCLWLLDASAPPIEPGVTGSHFHRIINKVDLPTAWNVVESGAAVHVSAVTGAGLDDLCAWISRTLVPEPPPAGAAVPFTPDLADYVLCLRDAIISGQVVEAQNLFKRIGKCSTIPTPLDHR
jgi:tRNA modification GTPase